MSPSSKLTLGSQPSNFLALSQFKTTVVGISGLSIFNLNSKVLPSKEHIVDARSKILSASQTPQLNNS